MSLFHHPLRAMCVATLVTSVVMLDAPASFATPPTRTLTVSKTGAGGGTVTSSPAGINCGATCSARFPTGSTVTLTAAAGSAFAGWSGGGCSGTAACHVIVNSNLTVTATFSISTFSLTAAKVGTGSGTVTSNPAGINCGSTCSAPFGSGTLVTLTAAPTAGSAFAGWSGGGCSGTGTCQVTMNSNTSVGASFTAIAPTLTVNKGGTGSGSVTSSPAGIDCGSTCSAQFSIGASVALTATPAAGSTFAGWSGGCTGTGTCQVTMNADTSVTATFALVTHTLTVTPAGGGVGTVTSSPAGVNCGATCAASFAEGTDVTLTAAPSIGSTFTGWSGGGCTGTGSCLVTLNAGTGVTATFALVTRTLTVQKSGSGTGTVSSVPSGINCASACLAQFAPFPQGATVTLVVSADAGSTFAGWVGAGCSGTGTCSPVMSSDESVSATFVLAPRTLTVSVGGAGSGTVTGTPAGIDCGSSCTQIVDNGTSVTLVASADTGSTFTGWSRACSGTGPCNPTMTADRSVTATFGLTPYTVQVVEAGAGTGTVASIPTGIDCGPTCSARFSYGTGVVLTATPAPGSIFAGWGGACQGISPCVLSLTSDQSVTATFLLNPKTVAVSVAGNGSGALTSVPLGIDCGSTCSVQFEAGSTVALTATPSVGSDFTGWSGACVGTGECLLTMGSDQSSTATFTLQQHPVTVSPAGAGSGTVTSLPPGIDCGSTCSAQYDSGTGVALLAVAAPGSTFAGWTGDCVGSGTCHLTVDAARNVGAAFLLVPEMLSVSLAGTGHGTVASAPAGIDCGTYCARQFENGSSAVLGASPSAGSSFTGWSGGGCSGSGTCSVTTDANKSVTATFTLIPRTLDVSTTGAGSGTVTSVPAGIDCGSGCSAQYGDGGTVTLIAAPSPGTTFGGWSGACEGTGLCSVAMNSDRNVVARFVKTPRTVTVSLAGAGTGSVTSSPGGVDCGAYCISAFDDGSTVSLTAHPEASSRFTGWSGACAGTGTCTLALTSDRSVIASFAVVQHSLTVTKAGPGSGTVVTSPLGILCGSVCSAQFVAGSSMTLTATPDAGSSFVGWTGACTGMAACQVSMGSDASVGATFSGPRQPDGAIRFSKSATFTGSGIIDPTGSGQSLTASVARGKAGTFVIELTNAGVQPDQIGVSARGTQRPVSVSYMSGSTNVTSAVSGGTFLTPVLDEGQSVTLTVRVNVARKARKGLRKRWLVSLTSASAPTAKDVVGFSVRVR